MNKLAAYSKTALLNQWVAKLLQEIRKTFQKLSILRYLTKTVLKIAVFID